MLDTFHFVCIKIVSNVRGISRRKEAIENKSHNSQSIARNGEKEIFEKKVSLQRVDLDCENMLNVKQDK